MDLFEAIEGRISIRAYKTTPVPKETLVKLLEAARRSPSWANTQPWEFSVLGGDVIAEVKRKLEASEQALQHYREKYGVAALTGGGGSKESQGAGPKI